MYFFSPSTKGFYLSDIHGENMPEDVLEVEGERYAELFAGQSEGKLIQPGSGGIPVLVDCPVPAPAIPQQVTMRQARLALLTAGKLAAVDAAIGTLPSPQKEAAEIEWDYSSTVDRSSPLMDLLGPALNLDKAALDALFVAAAAL
jgi:hypothetical protein